MTQEDQLLEKLESYKQLAKENPNVNVGDLMINALNNHQKNLLSTGIKRWAYLISLGFPPVGLLFAIYFYKSGKDDGKHAAYICIALTVFIIVAVLLFFKAFVATTGVDLNQLQQIKIKDIQELTQ